MWDRSFVLGLCALCFFATPATAGKRVALVIGNSAYVNAGELANPKNDATDMAAALKARGVEVIDGIDLDKNALEQRLRDFAAALDGADAGMFFYAGHGLQVNGVNYIVPIDAKLTTAAALEFEMVRLDAVQRLMESAAKTNLIFLDACRNNPLARNLARAMGTRSASIGRGLAPSESGVGTLISYSTQPGNVALDGTGRNSPFAGPLSQAIMTSSDDVVSILTDVRRKVLDETGGKQTPWENHALLGKFFFGDEQRSGQPPAASGLPGPADQAARESSDPKLERVPYGGSARDRPAIDALKGGQPKSAEQRRQERMYENNERHRKFMEEFRAKNKKRQEERKRANEAAP